MESRNNIKKHLLLNEKRKAQTDSKYTHVTLCVESKFMDNVEGCLDATAPEKYIILDFNKTSKAEDSYTDSELMSS